MLQLRTIAAARLLAERNDFGRLHLLGTSHWGGVDGHKPQQISVTCQSDLRRSRLKPVVLRMVPLRHTMRRTLLRSAATGLLAGCTPADFANFVSPRWGYSVREGIEYGNGPRHRLDLYLPDAMHRRAPLLVFFYGGNWEAGDRAMYRFVASTLVRQGYAVAVPDYRLYPDVRYPVFLEDCAAAVGYLHREQYSLALPDGPRILIGHSAGAYNAVELALDQRWLDAAGAPVPDAAIGLAGPYDFLPLHSPMLRDLFNAERGISALATTQPINHARSDAPPLLLLHGMADTTVSPKNSERLAAEQSKLGTRAVLIEYPDLGHIGLIGALARPLDLYTAPVLRDISRFVASVTPGQLHSIHVRASTKRPVKDIP